MPATWATVSIPLAREHIMFPMRRRPHTLTRRQRDLARTVAAVPTQVLRALSASRMLVRSYIAVTPTVDISSSGTSGGPLMTFPPDWMNTLDSGQVSTFGSVDEAAAADRT